MGRDKLIPHINVRGESIVDAYHSALKMLRLEGDVVDCPDWNTQCLEASATIVIEDPLKEPMISGLSICDPLSLEKYRMEMLDGLLDWSVAAGLEPYTYHMRIGAQEDRAITELRRCRDSRRAAITVRQTWDYDLPDAPCLQHIQFMIRNNALQSFVLFRSNDAAKAAFMNMFALVMLQKKVADALEVDVGGMVYTANSFHCYQRDWQMLEGYVRAIESGDPPAFYYVGDWDELMAQEHERILRDSAAQKEKRFGLHQKNC